jgi:cytochrome c oxidase subunit 4
VDFSFPVAVPDRKDQMTHPVAPVRTYVAVFLVLITLTITTVAVSKIDMGEFNFIIAITIAVIKAVLVILFFMHVKDSSAMTKVIVGAGFFWMAILLVFVLSDYLTRGWLPLPGWW